MASLIIAVATVILIIVASLFFPTIKIKKICIQSYWVVATIGALLLILFKEITINELINNFSNSKIGPIQILILFISMTILSIFLDEVNFFKYLATVVTNRAKNSQLYIFLSLYILTSVLTIFTSNDIEEIVYKPTSSARYLIILNAPESNKNTLSLKSNLVLLYPE